MSRYKIVRELGRNREAGRITYLASDTRLNPPQQVVIKEFRFALADAKWSGFKAYQREIEVLRELDYPRIPRYLDSFETKAGFCLVQEYKNAPSLAQRRSFNPEEIKQIAVSVLEILVYLQKRVPPIIHRDIKPENILVDKQLNAYLVDFGFARIQGGKVALSSIAAGTPGFMPPEELFSRSLTKASENANLGGAMLSDTNLENANLQRANLQRAYLNGTKLGGAMLGAANLAGAQMANANLNGAKVWEANLSGANLNGANLQGAQRIGSNLKGAMLWGANLEGANLRGATKLEPSQLKLAKLKGAIMPDGTKHE